MTRQLLWINAAHKSENYFVQASESAVNGRAGRHRGLRTVVTALFSAKGERAAESSDQSKALRSASGALSQAGGIRLTLPSIDLAASWRRGNWTCEAMRRTSFETMECPIARSLERVGEWWSMLILRDALSGIKRFDAFEASLKIAPNMLTRRLNALVEDGLMERRLYNERPRRFEYILTPRGRDFLPVLIALAAFGNRQFAPEGACLDIVDIETGRVVDPLLVDRLTGDVLTESRLALVPGPAATPGLRELYGARQPEAPVMAWSPAN
jgi:DNA-binding HxlR family transcriptional regulator